MRHYISIFKFKNLFRNLSIILSYYFITRFIHNDKMKNIFSIDFKREIYITKSQY